MDKTGYSPRIAPAAALGNRPLVLKVTAVLLVAGGMVWLVAQFFEPRYQGKVLSLWLEEARKNGDMEAFFAGDRQPNTRTANAVRAIGADGLPTLIAMVKAKETPFTRWREWAANRWTWLPINGGKPEAIRVEELREEAAYAFRLLGSTAKSARRDLVALLDDNDDRVRGHAAYCLGSIGPSSANAVPDLERYLGTVPQGGEEEYYALHALGDIGPSAHSALAQITPRKNANSPGRRSGWARAAEIEITGSGLDSAIAPLKDPSDFTNWLLAFVVVRELGSAATAAIPLLLANLQQTNVANPEAQTLAIEALGRIHAYPEQCIPAVIPFLRSPNDTIRARSLVTISVFGSNAPPWVPLPEIVRCLADPSVLVRETATNTLRRISSGVALQAAVK